MTKTTLPALYSDDRRAGLDDVEVEGVAESEANTVVDLREIKDVRVGTKVLQKKHTSVCHWWGSMPLGSGYQKG